MSYGDVNGKETCSAPDLPPGTSRARLSSACRQARLLLGGDVCGTPPTVQPELTETGSDCVTVV
jgi:hypothetical protein